LIFKVAGGFASLASAGWPLERKCFDRLENQRSTGSL